MDLLCLQPRFYLTLHFKNQLMENVLYLAICILLIALPIMMVLWGGMEENHGTASELHARDRYAVAERIDKEFGRK